MWYKGCQIKENFEEQPSEKIYQEFLEEYGETKPHQLEFPDPENNLCDGRYAFWLLENGAYTSSTVSHFGTINQFCKNKQYSSKDPYFSFVTQFKAIRVTMGGDEIAMEILRMPTEQQMERIKDLDEACNLTNRHLRIETYLAGPSITFSNYNQLKAYLTSLRQSL